MRNTFKIFTLSVFLFTLMTVFWVSDRADADEQDYYLQLKKSWLYMQRVYENLHQHYVEEIEPYPLIKAGIDGMLEKLDPYTVFIDDDGERRLQMITTGRYGGLGMEIGLSNKKITVISPIENSPAKRMGILAGDIIEKIDSQDISSWSIDKVSAALRGKIGTEVALLIRRPGQEKPYEITLTRAEIVIEDIGYAGFIEPGIAYVSLTGFTEKAPAELKTAISRLRSQDEIRGFILDLRSNPGGLLDAAIEVVNVFVDRNELVVFTSGFREEESKFYTRNRAILPDVPLIVMVNQGSASASEIVAGALQDLDRAVIVGEATFGKGLVQKVYPIDKNEDVKLKITTAKYYIPSGRCIQKRDYGRENGVVHRDSLSLDDSNPRVYFTKNKRKVFDKGGIYPDLEVSSDSLSYVVLELIRKSLFFDFAVQFYSQNTLVDVQTYPADSLMNKFRRFAKGRNFIYEIEGSRELSSIEKIARDKNYSPEIKALIGQLKSKLENGKQLDFENNQAKILELLHLELTEKYSGSKEKRRLALQGDKQISEALVVLKNSSNYQKILAIN
jgi:carboxyl-terminal processing protease